MQSNPRMGNGTNELGQPLIMQGITDPPAGPPDIQVRSNATLSPASLPVEATKPIVIWKFDAGFWGKIRFVTDSPLQTPLNGFWANVGGVQVYFVVGQVLRPRPFRGPLYYVVTLFDSASNTVGEVTGALVL